ncbi:MAG: hypothetical protein F4089_01965 [Gammaproteobacteria bacterium]|nr:hypothetical protein [Gammaproteobacteria bacterium]
MFDNTALDWIRRHGIGDPAPRLRLGAGATWRRGNLALHAAALAKGLISRDAEYGGRLELRAAF